ncbi:hypothetical protein [Pararhodospirillum oryzae]|uniref:Uncharacterized protein n=1 Tax=Pararhodospirillum oryzae TaxID=478448 RepID=A0A512H4D6_9PROT|nr:hypothetical protein [Pararhodospirillum oryzae]GEO80336.1 hypothetical protein ROR02_04670 [Pararhodospirillum oryzae]
MPAPDLTHGAFGADGLGLAFLVPFVFSAASTVATQALGPRGPALLLAPVLLVAVALGRLIASLAPAPVINPASADWALALGALVAVAGWIAERTRPEPPRRRKKASAAPTAKARPPRARAPVAPPPPPPLPGPARLLVPAVVGLAALGLAAAPGSEGGWPAVLASALVLGAAWLGLPWRLDQISRRGPPAAAGLPATALGVALVAWVIDRPDFVAPALSLAGALGGWFAASRVRPPAPGPARGPDPATVTGVAVLVPLAGALALDSPPALAGVLVAALALFADAPAARLPRPGGGAGRVLEPVLALATALAPVAIAGAMTVVVAGMPPG